MKITKKDSKTSVKSKKTLPLKKKSAYARKSLGTALFMTSEPEIRGRRQMMDAGMNVEKFGKKPSLMKRILKRLKW